MQKENDEVESGKQLDWTVVECEGEYFTIKQKLRG